MEQLRLEVALLWDVVNADGSLAYHATTPATRVAFDSGSLMGLGWLPSWKKLLHWSGSKVFCPPFLMFSAISQMLVSGVSGGWPVCWQ